MKLEVGKKYICRDRPEINYVRIDAIREDLASCKNDEAVVGTAFHQDGNLRSFYTCIDGKYSLDQEHSKDLVAEYEPSKIKITVADIGKKIKFQNGNIALIHSFMAREMEFQIGFHTRVRCNGIPVNRSEDYTVIEILN